MASVGEGELDKALIAIPLADRLAPVREHAIQIAAPRLREWPEGEALVVAAATDSDPRVQFNAALALGELPADHDPTPIAKVALHADRWTRAATLSSIAGRETQFLEALIAQPGPIGFPQNDLFYELGRVLGASQPEGAWPKLLARITTAWPTTGPDEQVPLLTGIADSLRRTRRDSTNLLVAVLGQPADANTELVRRHQSSGASGHPPRGQ